jgi:predicted kinase
MNDYAALDVAIVFDVSLAEGQIREHELVLVRQFLPELLKEMIWQSSEQE